MFVAYKNGNYRVLLNLEDGTKIRYNNENVLYPSRPESIDVKITNRCPHGCLFCHENSVPDGRIAKYATLIDFAEALLPYTEIAVGGGNVLENPKHTLFFLEELKKVKAIPSITVRQDDFINNLELLKEWKQRQLIYGIGVSLCDSSDSNLISCLKTCPTSVLHVIAGIFNKKDYENLKGHDIKMLVLGYKNIRRGKSYGETHLKKLTKNILMLQSHYEDFVKDFNTVAFDNLALEQLEVEKFMSPADWKKYYLGDDGRYTFYVDLVEEEFARSSTNLNRINIQGYTPQEMFNIIQGIEILKEIRNY